jgi:2-oxo-4-hydroxy-4-carboxy-5-ureidoimidazoline decarboxylase
MVGKTMITLAAANRMATGDFIKAFGEIAEHSAWVAEAASSSRPFKTRANMIDAFKATVLNGGEAQQLALIRAHPDLATRAKLSKDSTSEQKGAGLDALSQLELTRFTQFNDRYKAKFGFPFIFAVKGATKHQILGAFEQRINNSSRTEFKTAIDQVCRIITSRLEAGISA